MSQSLKEIFQQFNIPFDEAGMPKQASRKSRVEQDADRIMNELRKIGEHQNYDSSSESIVPRQTGESGSPAETPDAVTTWNGDQGGVTAPLAQQIRATNVVENAAAIKDRKGNELGNDHMISQAPQIGNGGEKLAFAQQALSLAADRILKTAGYGHLTDEGRIDRAIEAAVADNMQLRKIAGAMDYARSAGSKLKGYGQQGVDFLSGLKGYGQQGVDFLSGLKGRAQEGLASKMRGMGTSVGPSVTPEHTRALGMVNEAPGTPYRNTIGQIASNLGITADDAARYMVNTGIGAGALGTAGIGTYGAYNMMGGDPDQDPMMGKVAALNAIAEENFMIKRALEEQQAQEVAQAASANTQEKLEQLVQAAEELKEEAEEAGAEKKASPRSLDKLASEIINRPEVLHAILSKLQR